MEKEHSNWFELLLLSPKFRIVRHLLLQTLIILLSLNALGDENEVFVISGQRLIGWLCYYATLCLLCYINIYVLAPRLLLTGKINKYKWFILVFIIMFTIILVSILLEEGGLPSQFNTFSTIMGLLSSSLSICFILLATSSMLLLMRWMEEQKRVSELKITTKQLELNMLKQQINPHFLFNMLNNANVLLKRAPEEASQVLFKLEELLNYQFNDSTKENVSLDADINFLNDFLNLEKIRRDRFNFSITKSGDTSGITIPPLLFIPFVENAIKHNPDSEKESYVHITFRITDTELHFQCENSKPAIAPEISEVGGLGLRNIRRRLELLYPNQHKLLITNDNQKFVVALTIKK